MLSYPGRHVRAVHWLYWNSRDIVVKLRHCYFNVTSSYHIVTTSQCILELLGAFLNMNMWHLMVSKKKNPLVVWGCIEKSFPGITVCHHSASETAIRGTDFLSYPRTHDRFLYSRYYPASLSNH